jgi:cholesterol oxidase
MNMGVPSFGAGFSVPALIQFTMTADWEHRTAWRIVDGEPQLALDPPTLQAAATAGDRLNQRVLDALGDGTVGLHIGSLAGKVAIGATVHLLGGAPFGDATDAAGQLRGHPGLYVVDGAALPGNAGGAPPSLLIAALAEYIRDRALR